MDQTKARVILYIACSLDGFIARRNGDVDWLFTEGDYGYNEFYESIGTVLMGGKTYEQILTFGDFPYKGKECYVFSRKHRGDDKNVLFVGGDIPDFTRQLMTSRDKDIWLCGGSEIIAILMAEKLVDKVILFIHPIILGEGIPLFMDGSDEQGLCLVNCLSHSTGLVELAYDIVRP